MTHDRALKQAIRRRMQRTGEKYTEARRALLGITPVGERYPWFYEPYWDSIRRRSEQLADEEGEAVARASVYFRMQSHHLLFALTPFWLLTIGRGPSGPDGWLSQRPPVECNAAAIEVSTPLAAAGFAPEIERNRQIVDRALTLIDELAAGASEQARAEAETRRQTLGVRTAPSEASAHAAQKNSGPWGDRSKDLDVTPGAVERDHFLRRPKTNWFRSCRPGIADRALGELVDAWIEDLEHNYAELIDGIPTAWPNNAELDFEAVIEDLAGEDARTSKAEWSTGLPSPAKARVDNLIKGKADTREEVATQILRVERGISPQPDGIAAFPDERWRIRGQRLSDGTVMPRQGTHRIKPAPSA